MAERAGIAKWQTAVLWAALLLYALGRLLQPYPERFPVLLIVLLQVVSPAVFALVHGSIFYRLRGMIVFTVCCFAVATICESLSLRTGFPFCHYYFTGLMGPKAFDLPILLILAYLGIGYCSWILSLLILGYRDKPLTAQRILTLPLLAAFVMVLWDLSMDPIWATLDRAWIWRDGGPLFGVPVSNFLGWYLTAFLFYLAFVLYCRAYPCGPVPSSRSYWRSAILCYGVCALGNLFTFRASLFPPTAIDPSGRQWSTMDILIACTLVSVCAMLPIALLAWFRLNAQPNRSTGRLESSS